MEKERKTSDDKIVTWKKRCPNEKWQKTRMPDQDMQYTNIQRIQTSNRQEELSSPRRQEEDEEGTEQRWRFH
jgi:hypothetical protein